MLLGARGAQRDRQATRKLRAYSKQWQPGDTMRVFLPLIWGEDGRPDLLIGQVWGHQVNDVKELGLHTTFIPSLTPFDKDGNPIGTPDITYQFSRIAPIFVNGQRAGEIARVSSKPWQSATARESALEDVKKKYDTKNNREAIKPIIDRARYVILTEVISIKYVENQGCVKDSAAISSLALSDQFLTKLWTLMDNTKYAPEPNAKYFEIEICYPADPDKGNSGKAAVPAGLTSEYRLCNKYPEDFKIVESYFNSWSADSETIRSRATTTLNPDVIHDAIRQYCMLNSEFLDTIDSEDDVKALTNNIEIVAKVVNPRFLHNEELRGTIQEAISKLEQAAPMDITTPMPEPAVGNDTSGNQTATGATMTDAGEAVPDPDLFVQQATSGMQNMDPVPNLDIQLDPTAPRLDDLMHNPLNIGADMDSEDVLGGINYGEGII